MKFTLTDFMGVESAALALDGVVILAGKNHQGKSSTCHALAAVLSGDVMPLGLNKNAAGMLVRTGAAKARAEIEAESGSAAIEWPKAQRNTKEAPPESSRVAAGIAHPVDMDGKARAEFLRTLLQAEPDRDDLSAAMREKGFGETATGQIWAGIERDGWDGAHRAAGDRARKAKTEWGVATGEQWGERKAESWTPHGWDESLASMSEESLQAAVTAARVETESAVGKSAVTAHEAERIRAQAATLDSAQAEYDAAAKALEAANNAVDNAQAARDALPDAEDGSGLPCPHKGCGKPIRIVRDGPETRLEAAGDKLPPAELEKRRKAIADADGKLSKARAASIEANNAVSIAMVALTNARNAAERVKSLAVSEDKSADALDAMREAEAQAESNLKAFTAKREADRLHRQVMGNLRVAEVLAPDGVRKTVMLRKLGEFNERLAALCDAAKWRPVTVTDDCEFEFGGRPYVLLSKSEQYRVRVTVQAAVAELDGSAMVIMDGADILDNKGRGGLIGMLVARKLRALVGMTTGAIDNMPDLASRGKGRVYWIENGRAEEGKSA